MDFGEALRELKAGKRVARAGWNGKGMWLTLSQEQYHFSNEWLASDSPMGERAREVERSTPGAVERVVVHRCIVMRAADGSLVPGWLASQTDMLAEDWMVLS
jgi:hypothetical protein